VPDVLEQVGRDTATLFVREIEVAAVQRGPEVRRAVHRAVAALAVALALLTAFALANWAAVNALSTVLPDWLAPLVLAAVWIAVGVVLLVFLRRSSKREPGRRGWRALWTDQAQLLAEREQARDEARLALGRSLEGLTETLKKEAGEQIAAAAIPLAGGVVSAGEGIIDAADEITDAIEEAVPGGSLVNRALDVALVPGRYGIKVTGKFLRRRKP
jgi:hypothetical protein